MCFLMPRVSHASTHPVVHAPLSLVGFASAVAFCARIQLVLLADNVFFKLAGSKRGLNPPSYATQIQRLLLLYDCVRLPAMASLSLYTHSCGNVLTCFGIDSTSPISLVLFILCTKFSGQSVFVNWELIAFPPKLYSSNKLHTTKTTV